MEKVKDLVLYQVATDRNYKVGDKIVFDKSTITGQYEKTMNLIAKDDKGRICDKLYEIANSRFKRLSKKKILEVAILMDAYDVAIRDLAMENVRQQFFPDYPSRMHAMYLSENKAQTLRYMEEKATIKGKTYQAVAVKLNGVIFRAGIKDCMIRRSGQSYSFYEEKAKAYWSQKCPKGQAVEVLFEGEAEIVEILKEIKT